MSMFPGWLGAGTDVQYEYDCENVWDPNYWER
jgi:hypothetical protein